MFKYRYVLSLMAILALFAPLSVLANNIALTLVSPEGRNYQKPDEPIIIEFPFDILANITTQLALEIDTIDVSSLVVVDGNRVILTPPSPFAPGFHQLRLVEYAANGDIVELGNWRFEVRQSSAFQQQALQFLASINNSYLVAEDYSGDDPDVDKYHANGAADIIYSAKNNDRAVHFEGNLIYEEDKDDSINGEQVDLGQFLLSIDANKYARFNIGRHSINYNSLIYNGFNRRGISGQFVLPGTGSSVQLFSARNGDLRGFREGLGIHNRDDRVDGAVLTYQPLSTDSEQLTISAAYVNGSRREEDSTLGFLVEESEGDASSFVINALLLDKRARLYLEVAQSDFDFDGDDTGLNSERDNAYRFIGQYTGDPLGSSETPWLWDIGLEKFIVEPNFNSFANNTLASDRDLTLLTANLSKGQWSSRWFASLEEDNLDDRFNATNEVRSLGLELSYQVDGQKSRSLLGDQTYRLSANQTRQTQRGTEFDASFNPFPENDNTTDFIELFNEFNYSRAGWYFLVSHNAFTDDSNQQSDSDTATMELGGNYAFNEHHSINVSVNTSNTEEDDTGNDIDQTVYRLALQSYFKSLKVRTYLNADLEQIDDQINTDFLEETDRLRIGFSVAKQLREPKSLFPGIDLQLRGSYLDIDDRTSRDDDSDFYEIFMDINFHWDIKRPKP